MAKGDEPSLLDRLQQPSRSDEDSSDDTDSKERGSGDGADGQIGDTIVDAGSLTDRVADDAGSDEDSSDDTEQTGDGTQQAIDDSNVATGDGITQNGDPSAAVDYGAVVKEAAEARLEGGVPQLDPDDAHLLAEATRPQLDPDVVQARLGLEPHPPLPDDPPTDLAFGSGAGGPVTHGLEPSGFADDMPTDLAFGSGAGGRSRTAWNRAVSPPISTHRSSRPLSRRLVSSSTVLSPTASSPRMRVSIPSPTPGSWTTPRTSPTPPT